MAPPLFCLVPFNVQLNIANEPELPPTAMAPAQLPVAVLSVSSQRSSSVNPSFPAEMPLLRARWRMHTLVEPLFPEDAIIAAQLATPRLDSRTRVASRIVVIQETAIMEIRSGMLEENHHAGMGCRAPVGIGESDAMERNRRKTRCSIGIICTGITSIFTNLHKWSGLRYT